MAGNGITSFQLPTDVEPYFCVSSRYEHFTFTQREHAYSL